MGFKIPHKTARLVFEGDEFEGCEVNVSLEMTFAAQQHLDELKEAKDFETLMGFIAETAVTSWNLEDDDGKPLPVNVESFMAMPGWFGLAILNGWGAAIEKAGEVTAPLGKPSTNGSSPEEPNATMEASLSHQSS